MDIEEKAIIKEAQRGSIVAFESLVKKYDKLVLQLAYNMVNNAQDAEDIYQEVFVRVFKNIGRFQFKSEFSTWLYRVVVNYCINIQKKKKRAKLYSIDDNLDAESWGITLPAKDKNPEEDILNDELSKDIASALETLSPKQKAVFVLRHYHGKKLKDIAASLACSEGTVKNYLFRATQKMQINLRAYCYK